MWGHFLARPAVFYTHNTAALKRMKSGAKLVRPAVKLETNFEINVMGGGNNADWSNADNRYPYSISLAVYVNL
jgi:hypothetical protein